MALVLAIMVFASMSAFATDPEPTTQDAQAVGSATATITAPTGDHQYEVYQIFAGEISTNGAGKKVLSNTIWGSNSTNRGTGVNVGDAVDESVLNTLKALTGTDATVLATIDDYVDLTGLPVAIITNGAVATVPTGYYLIKDKDGTVSGDDAYTQYIVQIVDPVTIQPKADTPSSEKKVKDKNDSATTAAAVETDWVDTADYDIGDEISYKITATIPATVRLDDFSTYKLNFIDTMSKGLTYKDGSSKVYVDDVLVKDATDPEKDLVLEPSSANYTGTDSAYTDGGKVLTWAIANIKAAPYNVTTQGSAHTVRIEYVATLNSNAVSGTAGNPNKMHIEFSNNPHSTDDTGSTEDDTNIVFTFDLIVNKVDENSGDLDGAHFALFKRYTSGAPVGKTTSDAVTSVTYNNGNSTYTFTGTTWYKVAELTTGNEFRFDGIDDGDYVLVETATPTGYNSVAPYKFTISATHTDATLSLDSLQGVDASKTGDDLKVNLGGMEATVTLAAGELEGDVENRSGATLPSTGGIGTTIFYVAGSILVLAAAILLITKRRMGAND